MTAQYACREDLHAIFTKMLDSFAESITSSVVSE